MKAIFLAKSNGKVLDFGSDINKQRFIDDIKSNDKAVYRIERVTKKRTLPQNNFFWLYLEIIERETGNTTADMHEYVKRNLTPKIERKVRIFRKGKWVELKGMVGKGTSELTKSEMSDVMDKLSALTEVAIPDPNLAGFITNY